MMDYKISQMETAHIEQIVELESACFPDPWSKQVLENELQNPLAYWLVAENDGEVLGYIGSQIVPDEADMMNLAVKESARRQGVAHGLVEALLSGLKEKGVKSLTLEVRASNGSAIRLYRSFGFQEVGRRKNYYFHPTEDALILKKEWIL